MGGGVGSHLSTSTGPATLKLWRYPHKPSPSYLCHVRSDQRCFGNDPTLGGVGSRRWVGQTCAEFSLPFSLPLPPLSLPFSSSLPSLFPRRRRRCAAAGIFFLALGDMKSALGGVVRRWVTMWPTALGQRQGRCLGVGLQGRALGRVGCQGGDEVGWVAGICTLEV